MVDRRMANIERFEDLVAWQEARKLVAEIYRVSASGKLSSDFGLRDQIRRASVSVMSNIAEGFERVNKQEKLHFYNIARGSCGEVRSLTYVCEDASLLSQEVITALRQQTESTGKLITGLMRSFQAR